MRGAFTPAFLGYFLIAAVAYVLTIIRLGRNNISTKLIWVFAVLFRVIMLFSEPSLSDDVNRYLWDGHLLNKGINPYAYPVESPQLDAYNIPIRDSVNHAWMASPYLPAAQLVYATVNFIAPQNIKAFQIAAVFFDLLAGWLLLDLLRRLHLPTRNVLIYLWNPLVVIEFAHGAHIDALMIFLVVLSFWFLAKANGVNGWRVSASTISLALASLTKIIPIFMVPLFLKRWGWRNLFLFIGLVIVVLSLFSIGAGWGLIGELDGSGVFGALRIYTKWWNFNGGIYHWLEVFISGFPTPGAVPADIVGERPIFIAKLISTGLLGIAVLASFWRAHRHITDLTGLLRAAAIPLGAYILLSPTVHPWYATIIIPFLVFVPGNQRWPWIYLSLAVALSYITYVNPADLREYTFVRWVEYIPVYALLILGILVRKPKLISSSH